MPEDNFIIADKIDPLDQQMRDEYPRAPGWLPFEQYDMVQTGYPRPTHGGMIIRSDDGTDAEGRLLPPSGMWVKTEDVRNYLQGIAPITPPAITERGAAASLVEELQNAIAYISGDGVEASVALEIAARHESAWQARLQAAESRADAAEERLRTLTDGMKQLEQDLMDRDEDSGFYEYGPGATLGSAHPYVEIAERLSALLRPETPAALPAADADDAEWAGDEVGS